MTVFPNTIQDMKDGLQAGDFTAVELLENIFKRIEQRDTEINSFILLNKDEAYEQAKAADERGYDVNAPKLNGIPIAIKDNIVTEGLTTTAASKMLENFVPTYDATVITHLKDAGAVIVGKLNMDEFAMGGSSETSYFGLTRNPWDLERVPGGSSSGSAASVASRLVPGSLGTDTGGSVRNPAALNGIVGMKPTYGAVSRLGSIAFGSSLDQVGPMTLTVKDNALMLEVLARHDENDSTSLPNINMNYSGKIGQPIKGMKIAFPVEYKTEAIDKEVRDCMIKVQEFFEEQGAIVDEVSLPHSKYGVNVYYIISSSEASSNLQRYDGIKYGYRSQVGETLEELYTNTRSEGFGDEVKRRIMLGTFSLSSGQFELFYRKAAQVRTLIREDFYQIFEEYDVIMGPVTTSTAFKFEEKTKDPLEMYVADLLTVPHNLAGIPSMSVPAGFSKNNLPIGLQLAGKPLDEATIYQVAYAFEQAHDYVNQVPDYVKGE